MLLVEKTVDVEVEEGVHCFFGDFINTHKGVDILALAVVVVVLRRHCARIQ